MRCKACDYRLWNLSGRTCPECGKTFVPSEYEFNPNTVQFCCPHCDQAYYGTSDKGLLNPPEFNCVQCGQHIHVDQTVLRPAPGCDEDRTQIEANPWLTRSKRGFFKGLCTTMGWGMVYPQRLMHATSPTAPVASAWGFLLIVQLFYMLLPLLCCPVIGLIMVGVSGGGGGEIFGVIGFLLGFGAAIYAVTIAAVVIWWLTTHAVLRLTGETAHSIGKTGEALCYTCAANVFSIFSCLSIYTAWIGWIWWMVTGTLAVIERQKVSGMRAMGAVLAFPAACFLLVCAIGIISMFSAVAFAPPPITLAPPAMAAGQFSSTQTLGTQLQNYAFEYDGEFPPHALALLDSDEMDYFIFVGGSTMTTERDVVIAGHNLPAISRLSSGERHDLITGLLKRNSGSNSREVIAHRVGDYVFTCHGVDIYDAQHGGLWLVIYSPDPDVVGNNGLRVPAEVMTANGTVQLFPQNQLTLELAKQNDLRQSLNMPPLPNPGTITNNQPAFRAE